MKLTIEIEDLIVGIICGLLLVGYTGRYFSLKLPNPVYVVVFLILSLFVILDIIYEFSDLSTHPGFIFFSLIHNAIDLVLALALISHFGNMNLPYITAYVVPYLQNESYLFMIGAFMVVSNAIWIVLYPLWS